MSSGAGAAPAARTRPAAAAAAAAADCARGACAPGPRFLERLRWEKRARRKLAATERAPRPRERGAERLARRARAGMCAYYRRGGARDADAAALWDDAPVGDGGDGGGDGSDSGGESGSIGAAFDASDGGEDLLGMAPGGASGTPASPGGLGGALVNRRRRRADSSGGVGAAAGKRIRFGRPTVVRSTLIETKASGEELGQLDDFEYIIDGLGERANDRLRRSSAAGMCEFLAKRPGRALLQTHGKTGEALGAARSLALLGHSDAACSIAAVGILALLAQEPAIVAALEADSAEKSAHTSSLAPSQLSSHPTKDSSLLTLLAHSLEAQPAPAPVDKFACRAVASIKKVFGKKGAAGELGVCHVTARSLAALALQLATSVPQAMRRRTGGLKEDIALSGALEQAAKCVGKHAAHVTSDGSRAAGEGAGRDDGSAGEGECEGGGEMAEVALRCLLTMEAVTFLSSSNQERLLMMEVGVRKTFVGALVDIVAAGAGAGAPEMRRECWHAALKVLTNLTNENTLGCRCTRACKGVEALAGALLSCWHIGAGSTGGDERDVDGAAAVLGLLVNLIEHDQENCNVLAGFGGFVDGKGKSVSAAQFLADVFAGSRSARRRKILGGGSDPKDQVRVKGRQTSAMRARV